MRSNSSAARDGENYMAQKSNDSPPSRRSREHNVINFEIGIESQRKGNKRRTTIKIDPEDFLAVGGLLVALIFAVAMVSGSVPINHYTAAIVTFSACGSAIAKIIKNRVRTKKSSWIPYAIIALLLVAFGIYIWISIFI
jgi:hypothetical protein